MAAVSMKKGVKLGIAGTLAIIVIIGSCWFLDFPAVADPKPQPLFGVATGPDAVFYVYSRGGFIDHSYCWRIDAPKTVLEQIVKHLELHPSATIPKEFWRVPPFYWPRSLGSGVIPYRSRNFADDSRGSDGPNYFLLHDTARSRAYVLFKDNF